ncbi:hypothetical protein D3C77_632990 [compost metagenome]
MALHDVQLALQRGQLPFQRFLALGNLAQPRQRLAQAVGAKGLDGFQFVQRQAGTVLGRPGGASLHHQHQFALVLQHGGLVVQPGQLAFQFADLLLQGANALVGGVCPKGVAHLDVKQGRLTGALGGHLQGIFLQ